MARQRPNTRIARARNAGRGARRLWPYVLMAYERWQSLSPQEKERYKQRARTYAARGQEIGREAIARVPRKRRR